MTQEMVAPDADKRLKNGQYGITIDRRFLTEIGLAVFVGLLFYLLYRPAMRHMYVGWRMVDSYYTHGFLIPLVSIAILWTKRKAILEAPRASSPQGYVWVLGAGVMMLLASFLGFQVIGQISMIPMITGLLLLFQGTERTKVMWFSIAYLIFMIPLPGSVTQSFALQLKLAATEMAVILSNWSMLPMVRDGSFIYWSTEAGSDHLLVGEVCGGLRSLIALLAFGALMAYISKTRTWARILMLIAAGPIAIVANVIRIYLLCLVGYMYGSEVAAGTFHDVSGYLIFVIAFVLFFTLEHQLRRLAPLDNPKEAEEAS